jgi:hypothetical protein
MSHLVRHLAVSASLLSLVSSAAAFQPLLTDDTGTQGSGGNQIEGSYTRDRARSAGETTTTRAASAVYTRGVTDTLDLFVQANRTHIGSTDPTINSASGSGNASIGGKWRFFENEASKTSLAIKPEIRLPVSAEKETNGLGVGRRSYGITGILTQELGFGAIHANLFAGHDHYRETAAGLHNTTQRLSVAPVWDVAEGWKLALDMGTQRDRAGGVTTRTQLVEIGAIYSPNKDLDFAVGLIRRSDNVDPKTTTDSATAGVTWRFK